jgi:hypothetical protein
MTTKARAVVVLALMVCAVGCGSKQETARETFSKDKSCPLERVSAVARPELSSYDLTFGAQTPPREIAADPARLAMWKAEQEKTRAGWDDKMSVFEVGGCGEKKYYSCVAGKRISCSPMTAPVK